MPETASPDFLALQVRALQRSADFYEGYLGLERELGAPPGVIVFRSATIPFAIREPLPGTDLESGPVGVGIAVSLRVSDAQLLHDNLKRAGVTILMDPFDTPFGRTFMFQDPDGYALAIHGALPS